MVTRSENKSETTRKKEIETASIQTDQLKGQESCHREVSQPEEISSTRENTKRTGEDYCPEGFASVSEIEEKDISLPGLVEDAVFILSRVGKKEFLKEQKTDQSLEEIRQKADHKKSFLSIKTQ